MRKKLLALISVLLLFGCFVLFQDLQSQEFTDLNPVSLKKTEKIANNLKRTARTDFSCLLCNGTRVPFDYENNTFFIPLDMENDAWEKLVFSSGQPGYGLMFREDFTNRNKRQLIAEGEKIPFLVYGENCWAEYYLVFTGLPVIDLTTLEGFYSENITGSAFFYNTDFAKNGVLSSEYNGHIRGNTSRLFPKKGYKLNLTKSTVSKTTVKNSQKLFGMREDDDWILYAMYNDETKIRDKLSIEIWNEMGAEKVSGNSTYGTNLTYVEVVADNRYCGLYGLMERIDAKQLDLKIGDYLYKRKNPGGLEEKEFAAAKDPLSEVQGFTVQYGEEDQKAWLPMAELSAFIKQKNRGLPVKDNVTIDEDNLLRMWLFLQIITGHDQTAKNIFYVARDTGEGYRFSFAPWDMDLTWGNVSVGETNPLYTAYEPETFDDRVYWETADWLIDSGENDSREKLQAIYKEIRAEIVSDEEVERQIREFDTLLRKSGAYARDEKRWPQAGHTENCEELIVYAKNRLNFLDKALWEFECFDD